MKIKILTLFPKMFDALNESIIGRAIKSGAVEIEIIDIRDYSLDKHKKCDDTPFGGGAGMVMSAQPIYDAIMALDPNHEYLRIYLSPKGEILSTKLAYRLANENENILMLCGHYEGVDQRAIDLCIDMEISIGDYILTGGELAAMVLCDSVLRFKKGVLGSEDSAYDESFSSGLLEYPQYTRPSNFMGEEVPEVLLNGNHKLIQNWRDEQAFLITKQRRPDLIELLNFGENKKEL